MRMIPPELPLDLRTTAELRVHKALAADEIPGVALHSLRLPDHEYKLVAEADFVLIHERAVVVVEVKGGGVSYRGGVWTYSDRSGHSRTSHEGPFNQANSAMFAMRKRLEERLDPGMARELVFGSLVVTPDVDLPRHFEWDEETYIGRGQFSRAPGMRLGLDRALDHWTAKDPRKSPTMAPDLRKTVLATLRPDFDLTPGLAARAGSLDTVFTRLTGEQFDKLDVILDNPRVLCAGGAGTGKTFLAVDVARRAHAEHGSTLLLCRSRVLAAYLRGRLGTTGIQVAAFEDLSATRAPVATLVVDEAQDLMSMACLDRFDGLVEGGLEGGRWVMFHDPNGQAHVYDDFDPDALALLGAMATPAKLRTNCRNTKEIAFSTRSMTGADIGDAVAGSGPEAKWKPVQDRAQETSLLEAHLRLLREHDVPPGDITLISLRGDWDTSSARGLRDARRGRIRVLDADWAGTWPGDELTWCTPVTVKGLENRFVCVIDVDGLQGTLDHLYVALSRARAGLWVAVDPEAVARSKELFREHGAAALQTLRKDPR